MVQDSHSCVVQQQEILCAQEQQHQKCGGVQLALCLYAGQAGVEGERKWYFGTSLFFLKKSLLNARPNSGMDINIPLMNGIFASRDTFGLH